MVKIKYSVQYEYIILKFDAHFLKISWKNVIKEIEDFFYIFYSFIALNLNFITVYKLLFALKGEFTKCV